MRRGLLILLCSVFAASARGEDIVDVLRRSQQQRLDVMHPAAAGAKSAVVQQSFATLQKALPELVVELHVITGSTIAETLHGHIIVANESLADMPEGVRLFILAHELGHVAHRHWLELGLVYKRWVPGEVTPENTDPVAESLGREASQTAHRQEFEADRFALELLSRMGRPLDDVYAAIMQNGMTQDTATHPATRKRLASLRAAAGGLGNAGAAPATAH